MITVALIGAGVGALHLNGYRDLRDVYRVKWLCDLDQDRAQQVIGTDAIALTDSIDAVLQDPEVTLVDICLPPNLHFDVAMRAMEAGKDVICEKPLVTSLRDAQRLIDTAKRLDRKLYPVFQYRYGLATAQLAALEKADLLGKPLTASLETHWNRGADYYSVPWRGTWAGENGGAVLGHAIHNHDLISLLMGPPVRVSAFTDTRVNPIETEDCAAISMQTASGAMVSSSITLGAANDTTRLRLCYAQLTATSGTAPYAPADDIWTFQARDPALQSEVNEVIDSVGDVPAGFTGFLQAIAQDLSGRTAAVVTPEDGRRSIELVAAIYHAARTGTVVDLPLGADHPLYQSWLPAA